MSLIISDESPRRDWKSPGAIEYDKHMLDETPEPLPTTVSSEQPTPRPPFNDRPDHWRRDFFILLVVFICLASVAVGVVGSWFFMGQSPPVNLNPGQDGNKTVTQEESAIAAVAAKVSPSVVSIITSSQVLSTRGTVSQESAGTGIIVSSNGYVMTNHHVVEGATTVSVIDSEGDVFENVRVVGRDPLNDVAFLKISADKSFTPAEIGDSSTVRIGQQVVAIGNALGQYNNTVTSGIISAIGRPVTADKGNGETESLVDLIQTDASINPGNSGGPLLNLAGQVVGINTAIADDANGIGFALPINATKGVLAGVIENGTIKRSYVGVNYLSITPEIAREYDLPVKVGAYVHTEQGSAVVADGPADKAGIKSNDIIQKINNFTVGPQGGLSSILGQFRPGDTATVTILRGSETLMLELTFGEYGA